MARSGVVQLRPRTPAYSVARAAESWMEIAENARRLLAFTEGELRHSFRAGDLSRLRTLQSVHRDAQRVMSEGRRMSAWADAACADGKAGLNHGRAA